MSLPPESHRLRPDHLPTPFSAAQIRAASPVGRMIRLREESAGEAPTFRRVVYLQADADGAVMEGQTTDPDGTPIGEATTRRYAWLDLQRHASQLTDATTVQDVTLALPFGEFACWLYVVRRDDAEVRFWFARELPGMPVQTEEWVDGALTGRTVMIAKEGAAAPAGAS